MVEDGIPPSIFSHKATQEPQFRAKEPSVHNTCIRFWMESKFHSLELERVRRPPDTVVIFGVFSYDSQSKSQYIGDILKAVHLVRSTLMVAKYVPSSSIILRFLRLSKYALKSKLLFTSKMARQESMKPGSVDMEKFFSKMAETYEDSAPIMKDVARNVIKRTPPITSDSVILDPKV
jgi:hypothetical protein